MEDILTGVEYTILDIYRFLVKNNKNKVVEICIDKDHNYVKISDIKTWESKTTEPNKEPKEITYNKVIKEKWEEILRKPVTNAEIIEHLNTG